jgi:hypothetical protein
VPKKRARSPSRPCTTGELNKTVDALWHPLADLKPAFLVLDGAVHGIIEQNPHDSVVKFIHRNPPRLLLKFLHGKKDR